MHRPVSRAVTRSSQQYVSSRRAVMPDQMTRGWALPPRYTPRRGEYNERFDFELDSMKVPLQIINGWATESTSQHFRYIVTPTSRLNIL